MTKLPDFIVYAKINCQKVGEGLELLQLFGKSFRVMIVGLDVPVKEFELANPEMRLPFYTCPKRTCTSIKALRLFLTGAD